MKKTILTLLMATMSTGVMAEWVHVWGNDVLDAYAEPASIRKKGKNVVTQNMFDFKKPWEYNGNEYRSSVVIFEFDCVEERARSLESIFYAESRGDGAIVDSWSSPNAWNVVFPATPLNSFMHYACNKVDHN